MRGILHRKLNNKSGFTLAETLVALAISIILLAITMVGIIQYSRNLKLTEMDSTAKEIFIAAQNHLTAADASGELKRYREKALNDTEASVPKDALGHLMTNAPSDLPKEGIVWPSDNKEYYYIEYNTKTNNSIANLDQSILQYMLPFGAIDETVRADGRYIIEYNVKTATVYGVFYAEEDVNFSYLDIQALDNKGGRADTSDGRHTRRDYDEGIIGYYGGAMAGNLLSGETADLKMNIENKDTLKITVIDPNYFNKTTDNKGTLQTHLTLIVKGKESGNEEKFTLDLTDSDNSTVAPVKKETKKNLWWDVENIELKDVSSSETKNGLKYTIVLDDITRPGGHFADICKTLMPGEDIIVKVISSSSTALATVREAEGMTNSLFAARTDKIQSNNFKVSTASVGSIRHLENLDPQVSGVPIDRTTVNDKTTGKELYKIEYLVTRASLISDMDWETFFGEKDNVKSVYKTGLKEDASKDVGWLSEESFYGIYNKKLVEIKGNGKKISNVQIINKAEDKDLSADGVTDFNAGILRFVDNEITITNLTLKDFEVSADRNASMLIADVAEGKSVTLTNILVDGGTVKSNKGRGNAGALIGYTGSKVVVTNCAAVVKSVGAGGRLSKVYAGDAGGLIGEINKCSNSVIENCYTGGQTVDGKYESGNSAVYNVYGRDGAGGLVGKINCSGMQIKNSYSTCSVYIGETPEMFGQGAGGGLVGMGKTAITYSKCYATGLVNGDSNQNVGTFIGQRVNGDSYVSCYYLKDINEGVVKAVGNVQQEVSILGKSYDEMRSIQSAVESYPKDETLADQTYPFQTVNAVGARDKERTKGVHYGDWPLEEKKEVAGGKLFAYREKLSVNGKVQDSWYLVDVAVGKSGVVTEKIDKYLVKDKKKFISSYSYGFLVDKENTQEFESQFQGGITYFVVSTKNPDLVTIDGKDYYYYEVKSDAVRDNSSGLITTPKWKLTDKEDKEIIQFTFNPDFGCAIEAEVNKKKLGTLAHPYHVRSDKQLRNIAESEFASSYNDCDFVQSLDINLTDKDFKPFGGESFTGSYNAHYEGNEGYEINNFYQNIESNEKCGLVTEVGSKGEILYTNLHGSMRVGVSAVKYSHNIGSLSGVLRGKANNCYSDVTVDVGNSLSYSGNIGGLFGSAEAGAIIEGCRYETPRGHDVNTPFYIHNTVPNGMHIGGLVGTLSGSSSIKESSTDVEITYSQNPSNLDIGVGGLVGKIYNKGTIASSWARLSLKGICVQQSYFGGFVGIISGESRIENSYALLGDYGFNAGNGIYLFAGKHEQVTNVSGTVKNCHAVYLDFWNSLNSNHNYDFIGGDKLSADANCYMYRSTGSEQGVKYILNLNDYKSLKTFVGFDSKVWEVKNEKYPTLINNPESQASKLKAKAILKPPELEILPSELELEPKL